MIPSLHCEWLATLLPCARLVEKDGRVEMVKRGGFQDASPVHHSEVADFASRGDVLKEM